MYWILKQISPEIAQELLDHVIPHLEQMALKTKNKYDDMLVHYLRDALNFVALKKS
jgi:hypothetical protein